MTTKQTSTQPQPATGPDTAARLLATLDHLLPAQPVAVQPTPSKWDIHLSQATARVQSRGLDIRLEDPWPGDSGNPATLTAADLERYAAGKMPMHEYAPAGWHTLRPEVRALLSGAAWAAVALLPAPPRHEVDRPDRLKFWKSMAERILYAVAQDPADLDRNLAGRGSTEAAFIRAVVAATPDELRERSRKLQAESRSHITAIDRQREPLLMALLWRIDSFRASAGSLRARRDSIDRILSRLESWIGGDEDAAA